MLPTPLEDDDLVGVLVGDAELVGERGLLMLHHILGQGLEECDEGVPVAHRLVLLLDDQQERLWGHRRNIFVACSCEQGS
jgi:hypothetical protein